jgi:hypothetical protein
MQVFQNFIEVRKGKRIVTTCLYVYMCVYKHTYIYTHIYTSVVGNLE